MRFTVKNRGFGESSAFRVSVPAGADSYFFTAASLGAGQSRQYPLPDRLMGCGRDIVILVDTGDDVDESIETNNGMGFNVVCPVDSGVNHDPVIDP